jgi:hypothetical protein
MLTEQQIAALAKLKTALHEAEICGALREAQVYCTNLDAIDDVTDAVDETLMNRET